MYICMYVCMYVFTGSVLGLLLFLLYINYLPLNIHGAKLVVFAVDMNVLITGSDVRALQKN